MKEQQDALTGRIKGMMTGGAPAAEKVEPSALAKEAKAAIAAGKDEAAVRARYKSMTGQDLQ
jgi:hypothetical protein